MKIKKKPPEKYYYKTMVEAGRDYRWCGCGLSATQPLCDASRDCCEEKSVRYTAKENRPVSFCACYETQDPPFCDNAHKKHKRDYESYNAFKAEHDR